MKFKGDLKICKYWLENIKYRSIEGFFGIKKVLYLISVYIRNIIRGKLIILFVYSYL